MSNVMERYGTSPTLGALIAAKREAERTLEVVNTQIAAYTTPRGPQPPTVNPFTRR